MLAARILDWKRSKYEKPILHNSKSPENLRRIILKYIKILGEGNIRGDLPGGTSLGGAPYPLGAPLWLVGHLAGLRCPSSAIWRVLTWKKINQERAFGTKRRRLKAEPVQKQSRAPAELF